jgi:hypothetical protein
VLELSPPPLLLLVLLLLLVHQMLPTLEFGRPVLANMALDILLLHHRPVCSPHLRCHCYCCCCLWPQQCHRQGHRWWADWV